jgi:uncharacterized repeat protein (TIGR01451 family)
MNARSRCPALLPICGIVAGSLTLGGAGAPASAQTSTLVWEALFADSAVVTPTVVDGITVSVTTRDPFGLDTLARFDVAHQLRGNHFGYWRAYADFADPSQYVEFTFHFSPAVTNLTFIVLDLDFNDVRHESLTVAGWNAGTPFPPTVVTLGSGLINPAPGVFSSRKFCADEDPITDCNVQIRFDQQADSVTFVYQPGPRSPPDPALTIMGISDLRWGEEAADLRVTASGPAEVAAGAVVVYRVVVRNQGPDSARGVVVTDTLPTGFSFTTASHGGTWSAGVVTWPVVASLAVGDSLEYSVEGRAPSAGLLVNVAAAGAATLDPDPANNDGSDPASRVVSTMPLGVALNVLEVVDSVTAGSPTVHPASAQVVVVGTGADTLAWTVTSGGAAWLTFVTSTGTGSGTASWTLDVPSMRAGTYRDTLRVTLADGTSDTVAIRVEVVAPAVDWTAAVDEILGTTRLDVIQRRYLDQEGNADGAFNLGDLLALLDRLGVRLDDATLSRVMAASAAGRQK